MLSSMHLSNPLETTPNAAIAQAERIIANKSASLKKDLGVLDLALMQILYIVGLAWVGVAAKLGPSHLVFWLLAVVLFYIPTAKVVIYLSSLMPLEGGLYQWARLGLQSEFWGFLAAANLWLYATVLSSEIGLIAATNLGYALDAPWIAESRWASSLLTCAAIGGMAWVATRGWSVGKWVQKTGAVLVLGLFAALIGLPLFGMWRGELPGYKPLNIEMPALSLLSLNILGKMGFGALGGFEYVAIFAGECRDAGRSIMRSVRIAAPVIALMFILGTASVLAFVQGDAIDLIGPIPQVLRLGFKPFGYASQLTSILILCLLAIRLAQASISFAANARLPLVAGWDHLLPQWFTRLHARHGTPVNSVLAGSVATLVLALGGSAGVGAQEAFQLLNNAAGIFYALTYLLMFAIPLIGLRGFPARPTAGLRIAAVSGFAMTLLYVTLSIFPIVKVADSSSFTIKITLLILGANAAIAGAYMLARKRVR